METTVSDDGTELFYEITGTGPHVVVVDGIFCACSFGRTVPVATRLASRFTVITYDRRTRLRTDGDAPASTVHEVDDVGALLRATGGEAFVYGHGSGAALALRAAERFEGIVKLVLHDPPGGFDDVGSVHGVREALVLGDVASAIELSTVALATSPFAVVDLRRDIYRWRSSRVVEQVLEHESEMVDIGNIAPIGTVHTPTLVAGREFESARLFEILGDTTFRSRQLDESDLFMFFSNKKWLYDPVV